MEFEAVRAREQGRLLSKYQRDRAWVRGRLQIDEVHDAELHRMTRVARLLAPSNFTDVLPPLHDAVLVGARPGWWTITGYERVTTSTTLPEETACYQQSWFLVPARDVDRRR